VYIEGIEAAGHHVVAAVGGEKQLPGLVRSSSENAAVPAVQKAAYLNPEQYCEPLRFTRFT